MPGKVNPVIPDAVCIVAAQVPIGVSCRIDREIRTQDLCDAGSIKQVLVQCFVETRITERFIDARVVGTERRLQASGIRVDFGILAGDLVHIIDLFADTGIRENFRFTCRIEVVE